MTSALGWGTLAASSLVIGALLALVRKWPERQVGVVLAFGAGALISAVSFELAAEGIAVGSLRATAIDGFAAGALLVMLIDSMIPEATKSAGRSAGLLATLGFAVATALSSI